MAVSPRTGHPSLDDLYAFLKGKLSRQRHAELQEHLAQCPDCARRAMHGRVVMKSLERWTDRLPGPDLSRLLVRSALSRALRSESVRPEESQRLSKWLHDDPACYAGWFHFECNEEDRSPKAVIPKVHPVVQGRLKMLVGRGVKVPAAVIDGGILQAEVTEDDSWLAVEPEGRSQVRFRFHPASPGEARPYCLMVPCESDTRARLKTMMPRHEEDLVVEASFDGLTFGPYVVAIEPASN